MFLYFLRGSLPWQGLKADRKSDKDRLILEKKETIDVKDLCEGLPQEFATYFDYLRSLSFEDKPNYSYLRKLFRGLFVHDGFEYDNVYDWTILKYLMTFPAEEDQSQQLEQHDTEMKDS